MALLADLLQCQCQILQGWRDIIRNRHAEEKSSVLYASTRGANLSLGYCNFLPDSFSIFPELFVNCDEIKDSLCKLALLCHLVYLLLARSLTHKHPTFPLCGICCKPVWNRISRRLCLVQQAYTYFGPSHNAAQPLMLNARHTLYRHSRQHTCTDFSLSCYLMHTQPQSVCLQIFIWTQKVSAILWNINCPFHKSRYHHI